MMPPKPNFRTPDLSTRVAMFGKFNYTSIGNGNIRILGGWTAENVIKITIPQLAGIEGCNPTGTIYFHKKGVEQIEGFFETVERRGLKSRIKTWAGSFVPRFIRGSNTQLSNHAWGTAFDINAAWNGLGKTPAQLGKTGSVVELVSIANEFGFYWGGHYNSRPDGMHFELAILNRFPKAYSFLSNDKPNIILDDEIELDIPQITSATDTDAVIPPVLPATTPTMSDQAEVLNPVVTSTAEPTLPSVPEPTKTETVNAPPKEDSTAAAIKTTVLGITVPAFVGIAVKSVTDLISQGYVSASQIGEFVLNLVKENQKYVLWIVVAIIALLGVKKAFKQITLLLQMWLAGSKDKNNVEVKPS